MRNDRIFPIAVTLSLLFHVYFIVMKTDMFKDCTTTLVKIPVVLEQEKEKPKPLPPKPQPKPPRRQPEKKEIVENLVDKPQELEEEITEVVQGEGLRTAKMVDAPVGRYKKRKSLTVSKEDIKQFLLDIRRIINKNKQYPPLARRFGITGKVKVSFVILPDGSFDKLFIVISAGSKVLDKAALRAVQKASSSIKRDPKIGVKAIKTAITIRYTLT